MPDLKHLIVAFVFIGLMGGGGRLPFIGWCPMSTRRKT